MNRWTITIYPSFHDQYAQLWVEHPDLRAVIRNFETDLRKHLPDLELYIERIADRPSPHLWSVPLPGLTVLIELLPEDRKLQFVWIKLPQNDPE